MYTQHRACVNCTDEADNAHLLRSPAMLPDLRLLLDLLQTYVRNPQVLDRRKAFGPYNEDSEDVSYETYVVMQTPSRICRDLVT